MVPAATSLQQVIRQVAGQSLRPVAACRVDIHIVAEPLVYDFMGQGGFHDKGQLYHLPTQEGEGGHGIARGQHVFHDGKALVGIGREQAFVQVQIFSGMVDVVSARDESSWKKKVSMATPLWFSFLTT